MGLVLGKGDNEKELLLLLALNGDGKRPEKLNLWVSKHGTQSGCDGRVRVKGPIG